MDDVALPDHRLLLHDRGGVDSLAGVGSSRADIRFCCRFTSRRSCRQTLRCRPSRSPTPLAVRLPPLHPERATRPTTLTRARRGRGSFMAFGRARERDRFLTRRHPGQAAPSSAAGHDQLLDLLVPGDGSAGQPPVGAEDDGAGGVPTEPPARRLRDRAAGRRSGPATARAPRLRRRPHRRQSRARSIPGRRDPGRGSGPRTPGAARRCR